MLDFSKIKKVYFIGIGGIMMSAVAKYFLSLGIQVSGSDTQKSEITRELEAKKVKVNFKQIARNISADFDLVVYTKAISRHNSELLEAKKFKLPVYSVYQILGELSREKDTIAVSGMHGKSTTTAMLGLTIQAAGLEPTVFVGTKIKEWQSNFRAGRSKYLVSEACEYRDNFLNYHANLAVITNIEAEHLDYFKNLAGVMKSFKRFTGQIAKDGYLVSNGDNQNAVLIARQFKGKKFSFGIKNKVDFRAVKIKFNKRLQTTFVLKSENKEYDGTKFKLKVLGEFNIYNALAAISAAAVLGIQPAVVKKVLEDFGGVWRRFEFMGQKNGVEYYDDYAHHPTEIEATLKTAKKKFGNKKFWLIYQPHLYSRTRQLMDGFARSLNLAENLILVPIYAAREKNKWGVESDALANLINKKFKRKNQVIYLDSFDKVRDYLNKELKSGDVAMTMGAGDIYKIFNF
jgi:UDP-N-acetylmuramate--alanine ligase